VCSCCIYWERTAYETVVGRNAAGRLILDDPDERDVIVRGRRTSLTGIRVERSINNKTLS
jgi:hypothetical protein